jgi:hypothetical protein
MDRQSLLSLLFFGLTILLASIILYPTLDYQQLLSQGDHGRDLYAFWVTSRGDAPYRDYWWVYGPLVPYIYSVFFLWSGVQIPGILLGQAGFVLLSAGFFYGTLLFWSSPLWALTGTLWFLLWRNEFFFTYHHTVGIAWLMMITFGLSHFLRASRPQGLAFSLFFIFLLLLTKLNFGVMALIVWLVAVWQHSRHFSSNNLTALRVRAALGALGAAALAGGIYYGLLKDMPAHEIRQCLPFLAGDQPYSVPLMKGVVMYAEIFRKIITASAANLIMTLFLILCGYLAAAGGKTSTETPLKKRLAHMFTTVILLFILMSHEFLASGVRYRQFWAEPFGFMLLFLIIPLGLRRVSMKIQIFAAGALLTLAVTQNGPRWLAARSVRTGEHYLALDRGKVFTGNDPGWNRAVEQTTLFLKENLRESETFFALPYDAIYYYLTTRRAPTRQLIFFGHINIPEEQERKVIADLERHEVNWVVMSSRMNSLEYGLGMLGKTYCPVIGKYLDDNFEPAARFGDWQNHPGWNDPHGTLILRRKTPLPAASGL